MESSRNWAQSGGIEDRRREARHGRQLLFEQFKCSSNSKRTSALAREFTGTVHDGLRSAQAAWRKATPEKRAIWLLVPAVIVAQSVAERFSAPWYYEAPVLLLVAMLVGLGSGMRRAMRRKLP